MKIDTKLELFRSWTDRQQTADKWQTANAQETEVKRIFPMCWKIINNRNTLSNALHLKTFSISREFVCLV